METILFSYSYFSVEEEKISKEATTVKHDYINQTVEPEMTYNALDSVDLSEEHEYTKVQLNNVDATYATFAYDNINSNKKTKQRTDIPSGAKYSNLEFNCSAGVENTLSVSNTNKNENDKYSEIQHVQDR